jgi:hypothetical protein
MVELTVPRVTESSLTACRSSVIKLDGVVQRYLIKARGFETGQTGDYTQMYFVHPLVNPDCEIVVYIDFLDGSFCFLCCKVRPVAETLP